MALILDLLSEFDRIEYRIGIAINKDNTSPIIVIEVSIFFIFSDVYNKIILTMNTNGT